MAKIIEQTITVKLSKLTRDDTASNDLSPEGFAANLEALATELVGDDSIIVEVVE